MTLPFVKKIKNALAPTLVPGYIRDDFVINNFQRQCVRILGRTIQFEEEGYLSEHPEICAMLIICVARAIQKGSRHQHLKLLAQHFTRPYEDLDKEIREYLKLSPEEPYYTGSHKFGTNLSTLMDDLWQIYEEFNPILLKDKPVELSRPTTQSSSFISLITSETTQATPEPTPVRSPTASEIFYGIISKLVDKVTVTGLEDYHILYDAAYVAIMKAVENAMEITVEDVKQDIITMLNTSYRMFNIIIDERAKIIAEQNWEKRMRKKLKRTLRRVDNFKGYVTPPTPKSFVSSHESYKRPPPPPCECHPQFHYNRYAKDRFGIYLPQEMKYAKNNVTLTPVTSMTELTEEEKQEKEKATKVTYQMDELTKTTSKSSIKPTTEARKDSKALENTIDQTVINESHSADSKMGHDKSAKARADRIQSMSSKSDYIKEAEEKHKKQASETEPKDLYTDRLKLLTFVKRSKEIDKNIKQEEEDAFVESEPHTTAIPKSKSINFKYAQEEKRSSRTQRRRAVAKC